MYYCIEAEKLYQRDPQIKREDVKILQEWLKKQPHLPKIEESQVIIFLHSCYYSLQATKKTIDSYFTRRTLHPELFRCPPENDIKNICSISFKRILSKKTPEGYTIYITGLLDPKIENYNYNNEILLTNLIQSLYMHKQGFGDGLIAILDFRGGTLGHLARVNLSTQKCMLDHMQEGAPVRLKGIHIVNAVAFMDKVMALVKPFMSSKLLEMIHIHSTLDTLYKYVPKECLPADYGGELPSGRQLQEEMMKEIYDNLDFFKWHDSQVVDESKRNQKTTNAKSNFGMEGTFKKLQID